jgi:ubiquinone/menaquinone biosynthesis C-methylase UbiE
MTHATPPLEPALHEMNPLERFSDRADTYAQHRPSYPAAAIAAILAGWDAPAPLVAADVGAGTGISARLLADRGVQVWAIEPNLAMQQAAAAHDRVQFHPGTAESTGLPTASVDLVTCFQSFHWFDPDRCLPEFRRILKPTGRLAVVWNSRDRTDGLTQGYSQIVQQLSGQHPAEQRLVAEAPLLSSSDFPQVTQASFPYSQALDLPGLIGRAQSVSYIPSDTETQQQLRSALTDLHQRWQDDAGLVYLAYQTRLFWANPL